MRTYFQKWLSLFLQGKKAWEIRMANFNSLLFKNFSLTKNNNNSNIRIISISNVIFLLISFFILSTGKITGQVDQNTSYITHGN